MLCFIRKPRRALRSFAELAPKSRRTRYFHASPKSSPKLRRTHSDASPKSPPKLRRCFAELSSDTSPKSPPKLRRTQLRYFAEVTSEASPNSAPILRRSHLRSFAELSHKLRRSIHYKDTFQVVLALLHTTVYRRT